MAKKLLTIAMVMLFAISIVALAKRTPTQHEPIENPQYTPVYERGEFVVNGFSSGGHQVISSVAADISCDTSDAFEIFLWADSVSFFYRTAGADNADADSIFLLLSAQDLLGYWHIIDTLMVAAYADAADDSSTIMAIVGTAEVYAWAYKAFRIVHEGIGTTNDDTVFGIEGKWQRGL